MTVDLTDEQRNVVECDHLSGHILLIAPPGSGKTLSLASRIHFLLQDCQVPASQILAITFSRRAAGELQLRLSGLRQADLWAGTFHAWCARLLSDRGSEIGIKPPLQILSEVEQEAIAVAAYESVCKHQPGRQIKIVKNWISQTKTGNRPHVERYSLHLNNVMPAVFEAYQQRLKQDSSLDYDDLIERSLELLRSFEERDRIHRNVRYLLVDEFHDVSPDQYQLIRAIAPPTLPERQVLVVADPNQSIYGFRGAMALEALQAFKNDYHPVHYKLTLNRRSSPQIVAVAKAVIEAGPAIDDSHTNNPAELPVDCYCHGSEYDEAKFVSAAVQRALSAGYEPHEIGILYRLHLRADAVETALIDSGMAVYRVRDDRFLDRPMAREAIRYLEMTVAVNEPGFEAALNWPQKQVDEFSMVRLRMLAAKHGLSLSELAYRDDLLFAETTPMLRMAVQAMREEVIEPLRQVADQSLQRVSSRLLQLLRKRRSAVLPEERADLRDTLDYLGIGLREFAKCLGEAIESGGPFRCVIDGSNDSRKAAELFTTFAASACGLPVETCVDERATRPVTIEWPAGEIGFDRSIRQTTVFTVTAQLYRVCQMVLIARESAWVDDFVVLDLETTSNRKGIAEIMQIGATVISKGEVTDETFASNVRPSESDAITADAIQIHGLTWDQVKDSPLPAEILPELIDFVGDRPIAGHNVLRFDLPILRRVCEANGLAWPSPPVLDTLVVRRRLHPNKTAALNDLLTEEERRKRGQHDAAQDTQLSANVVIRMHDEVLRDREIDLLAELLPLVADSIEPELRLQSDNQLLWKAGERMRPGSVATYNDIWNEFEADWQRHMEVFVARHPKATVTDFLDYLRLAVDIDSRDDLKGRVHMMSIHAAKGLEWRLVILLGLEDSQFSFAALEEEAARREEEEGRRVLYVGITRARQRLMMTWVRDEESGRSRYLEAAADLIEFKDR